MDWCWQLSLKMFFKGTFEKYSVALISNLKSLKKNYAFVHHLLRFDGFSYKSWNQTTNTRKSITAHSDKSACSDGVHGFPEPQWMSFSEWEIIIHAQGLQKCQQVLTTTPLPPALHTILYWGRQIENV